MQGCGPSCPLVVGVEFVVSESFGRRKMDKSMRYVPLHNRAVRKSARHGVDWRLADPLVHWVVEASVSADGSAARANCVLFKNAYEVANEAALMLPVGSERESIGR